LPNGEKVELHELTSGEYRVTVFSADDQDWEDYETIEFATALYENVSSLDEMFERKPT
jgi:major membrane immunogen (membrane-anchored lipoprotein)